MSSTSSLPQVKLGDILKVTNEGATVFRNMWDLVDYVIPPGGFDFLPFEAIKLFFGDPRSTDVTRSAKDQRGVVSFIADRATEVRRLRLMYSHGFGDYTGKEGAEVVWEQTKIPHCKVETLQGERVFTVIDDPAGSSVLPAVSSQADDARLRDLVEQQGAMIRMLMDRIGMESLGDLANPGTVLDPTPDSTVPRNIYNPATDTIEPAHDEDPTADPEMYDDLPEDR